MTQLLRTSFDAYLFCLPTNLDAHCSASSFHVRVFFFFFFYLLRDTRTRAGNTLSVVSSGCRDTPRPAKRVSRPPPPREFSKFVPLSKDISETRRGGRVPRTH